MKKEIVWIDDDPKRAGLAALLRDELGIKVSFMDMKKKDLAVAVDALLSEQQPQLVILDHMLDKTSTQSAVFQRGSTIAEAIKEKWPKCPVLGVTNVDLNRIDLRTKKAYDELYETTSIGDHFDEIKVIAHDFAKIGRKQFKARNDVVKLFCCPKPDLNRLEASLSQDLRQGPWDDSIASRLFSWIRDYLTKRPGFLYDELWSATYLGLTLQAFRKRQTAFEKAVYSGPFALERNLRWWKSTLSDLIYGLCPPGPGELTWHVGRRLPGLSKADFSKCFVCNQDYPDVVAYLDADSLKQEAMHSDCTKLHPKITQALFFEDARIMDA